MASSINIGVEALTAGISRVVVTVSPGLLENLKCPISLDTMRDPVVCTQSGISYDRESLCQALLVNPDKEPSTNQQFKQPLGYTANIGLRAILTQACGDKAYVAFNDAGFAAKYQEAWKRMQQQRQVAADRQMSFQQQQQQLVAKQRFAYDQEAAMYDRIASLLFGMKVFNINIAEAFQLVSNSMFQQDAIVVGFKALMMDPRATFLQLYAAPGDLSINKNIHEADATWMQADRLGLRRIADGGNPWAQALLAARYHDGLHAHRSKRLAKKWAEKAAAQDNVLAQFQLGWDFYHGSGLTTPQDYGMAFTCLSQAVEKGHSGAENLLAMMHLEGNAVEQNDEDALHYCLMAAQKGFAPAQFNLAKMAEQGQAGVPAQSFLSDKMAINWYRRAAEQGHVDAQKAYERLQ